MKRFLVTGCPRSGTGYAAALFRSLGVRCGHEDVFGPGQAMGHRPVEWNGYGGDSSWLAVPLLPLEDVEVVLHQVRHPHDVIRSLLGTRFFAEDGPQRFTNVARRHAPNVFRADADAEKAALFWHIWNTKTEKHATITYRLEDLDVELVLRLAGLLELEVSEEQAVRSLDRIPRNVNTRRRDEGVLWNNVRPIVEKLANRYGY